MPKIQRTSREIKRAIFDVDDTLRPQLEPLVEGLEQAVNMFDRLFVKKAGLFRQQFEEGKRENGSYSGTVPLDVLKIIHDRMSQVTARMIRQSMAEVFERHDTTDYHYLFQEMDLFEKVFEGLDPKTIEKTKSEFVEVGKAVIRKVKSKKEYSTPYRGIPFLLKTLRESGIECYAYSNAPIYQVLKRLKEVGLLEFFVAVYGVRDEVASVVPMLTETKVRLGEYGKDVKWKVVKPKPNGKLSEIMEVPPEFVHNHVAVIGDSKRSDMRLAAFNDCLAILALWGGVDPYVQLRMEDFSTEKREAKFREDADITGFGEKVEIIEAATPYVVPKILIRK